MAEVDRSTLCTYVKNRFNKVKQCNSPRAPKSEFCHTHHMLSDSDERVTCPLDPSHTVYKKLLEKHLKICTTTKKVEELKKMPCFCENINLGYEKESSGTAAVYQKQINKRSKDEQQSNLSKLLNTIDKDVFFKLTEKVEQAYNRLFTENTITYAEDESKWTPAIVEHFKSGDSVERFQVKHGEQQLSLVHLLEQHNCLSQKCDYIEFGCGVASLSYIIRQCLQLTEPINPDETTDVPQFILVDRSRVQKKQDSKITLEADKKKIYAQVDRLVIDIAHLNFDKIPFKHDISQLCTVSKHLCGVATDLTLRCITKGTKPLKGIFIALCCHHACNYKSYINKPFFIEQGFTEEEFECMKLLTSWALVFRESETEVQDIKNQFGMTGRERAVVGMHCKRLIDLGRVEYLNNNGYNAKLVYYCDAKVTPENVMLIATPKY